LTLRVNQSLAKTTAIVNCRSARPPRLIQIVAPFSSRLSRNSSREDIEAAFRHVGLDHLIDRLDEEAPWDHTLSGGEKQRLAFARVFLHNPDIIVLDEATAALDTESQDRLMQLVSKQPSETTLISVGHRPEL
jgi:vitamin B12/bleomycin/antimicrobial peptide transport system ATP-binding/permease protein